MKRRMMSHCLTPQEVFSELECHLFPGEAYGASGGVYWQFRWVNNPKDKEIHGPYESSTFLSWIAQVDVSPTHSIDH